MGLKQFIEKVIGTTFVNKSVSQKLGVVSFGYSSQKRYDKKPHELMRDCLNAYESRPIVHSGINQLASLITGGHLTCKGTEEKDVDKIQKWIDYRLHIHDDIELLVRLYLITGNVPVELSYILKNDKLYIDDFFVFPRPERFYRTLYVYDENGNYIDNEKKYWLIEVDRASRGLLVEGKSMSPEMFRISYSPYAIAPVDVIYAIPFHKKKFCYLRTAYKKWFFYSFSFVMSSLDDIDAMYNIIQNIIGISKYKAVGKSIVNIGDEKDPATPQDIESLKQDLQSGTFTNLVINKKVNKTSLSYEGDYNTMTNELDFLRREITSGLSPNYLTPWGGSETNRSNAQEIKLILEKQLQIWRRGILDFLNDNILKSVKEYLNITSDVEFDFVEMDLYTPDEKHSVLTSLYDNNLVTANEYRVKMGLESIDGGDLFKTQFERSMGVLDKDYDLSTQQTEETEQTDIDNNQDPIIMGEQIKSERKISGHIIKLNQEGDTWQVLDGSRIILSIDDEQTARLFLNNYINKIRDNKLPLSETDYKEEEESISQELNSTVKDLKKDIEVLLNKHTENFTEAGKIINTDIIPDIDLMFDKAFNNLQNKFKQTIANVFGSSKMAVMSAIAGAVLGKGKSVPDVSAIQNIDMKSLKMDAVQQTYEQDLKNLKNQKVAQLSRMVADASATGMSSTKIKSLVMQAVGDVHHEADRILRTNINRTSTMSKLLMYKQLGIKQFEWMAHIDERTREAHRKRNGRVFNVEKALAGKDPAPTMVRDLSGKWIPSENINCRCNIKPYFK